ncbi:MAG: lasso peptide biosynthesis B2 protein [Allosphingosinicella sp.]
MEEQSNWNRIWRISWSDRWLLVEACAALALASAGIAFLPFRRLAALLDASHRERKPVAAEREWLVRKCCWSVTAAGRRLPWRIVCFQKGLALHLMLRRRGIASILHYGIAREEAGLAAHVWVTLHGRGLIGDEVASDYALVASFPKDDPDARGALLGR